MTEPASNAMIKEIFARNAGYPRSNRNARKTVGKADIRLHELDALMKRILVAEDSADHVCGFPEMGTYEGQVVLVAPDWLKHKWPNGIGVDVCLALEIQNLWREGIRTSGHCCGHGRAAPFISVWPESEAAMVAMGYEVMPHSMYPERSDHFVPKTRFTRPSSAPAVTEELRRDETGRITSDYEPTSLEIEVCRAAIRREFGNNGTDGYYIRILKAVYAVAPTSPSAPAVTEAMVEAACKGYWPLHWPANFDKSDAESIRKHMRAALKAAMESGA